jgi:translocator protein
MNSSQIRSAVVVLAVAATIAVNLLANALPLNNLTTGEISNRFQVYFVPAGYVFSIWGLIYLALIAYAVYRLLPGQRHHERLDRIDGLFVISCLANISWLFLWHYQQFWWTLVAMAVLLSSLVLIYRRLDIGRGKVGRGERWLVHAPFSLYLGWVSVATIANVSTVLVYAGWGGWGISPVLWAVIMLTIVVILSAWVSFKRADVIYSLVLIWAFIGIAVKQAATAPVSNSAWVAAVLTAALIAAGWGYRRRLAGSPRY